MIRSSVIVLLLMVSFQALSQKVKYKMNDFTLLGTAKPYDEEIIRLTENELNVKGAMWYKNDIDLTEEFDFEFDIYFGCSNGGADGIVFTLHPEMAIGEGGRRIGFGGLKPSFGAEMDTYQQFSLGDIHPDHAAFLANGVTSHEHFLSEPVPLKPFKTNIENCEWHVFQITWNPRKQLISFFFDGVYRLSRKIDLVEVVFGGNPNVFWGLTSATGRHRNHHLVKVSKMEFSENDTVNKDDEANLLNGDAYVLEKLFYTQSEYELPESIKPELDKIIRFHSSYPDHTIILDSYIDGDAELARKRAKAMAEYLNERGIPGELLLIYGNEEEGESRIEVSMKVIRA